MNILNPEKIYEKIVNCKGYLNCYGIISKKICPVAFRQKSCSIMVITEQPLEDAKRLEERIIRRSFGKGRVPYILNDLLCDYFFNEFKRKIYWAHFIKCIGNLRSENIAKGFNKNRCAEQFLLEEIKAFRPRLIITVGSNASNFILKNAKPRVDDWRELFWSELKAQIQNKIPTLPSIYDAKIFTLTHPSRANPTSYLNMKLKSLIKQLLEIYL